MTKVMRKEARHTQRRIELQESPWKFSSIYPKTRVCLLYCFVLSLTPLNLWGSVPHHLFLKKS